MEINPKEMFLLANARTGNYEYINVKITEETGITYSSKEYYKNFPELIDISLVVDLPNNVSTSTDNLPELIDVSLDTFDLEFIPIDESTRDLAKMSFEITSSISQFFDDHPFAFHLLHVIGFFGLIFFKSNQHMTAFL